MDFHLVSFKTCPYVQRSVITLKHKGIDFQVTYIDLENRPDWFMRDSPLGKVPILKVTEGGSETVLFESAVINEFIDEVTPGSLLPADPLQKARARAWIEFASECLMDYYQAAMAGDEEAFTKHRDALVDKLGRLQEQVKGPFFLGTEFSLVDTAVAPLLMRLEQMGEIAPGFDLGEFPKLRAWLDALQEMPQVTESMVPEWRDLNLGFIRARGGHLAQVVSASR